jgi:nucleoside-specific outer membrane channel protein Tsx
MKQTLCGLFLVLAFGYPSHAATWSKSSISLLEGSSFQLGDSYRKELTFEQASAYDHGDNFFWLDVTNPGQADSSGQSGVYGEWITRYRVWSPDQGKLFKNLYVAYSLEFGDSGVATRTQLYGLSIDSVVPGFLFLKTSLLVRDALLKVGQSLQLTIAYQTKSMRIWNGDFYVGGYIDYVMGAEGESGSIADTHLNTAHQFLYDVGRFFKKENTIYSGIEYQYWSSKYGIPGGPLESHAKWMIKWIF